MFLPWSAVGLASRQKFPVPGIAQEPVQHIVGSLEEALTHALHVPGVQHLPALGLHHGAAGLTMAWSVYGVRPLKAGEVDPVKRLLGPYPGPYSTVSIT